jgi:hypothetical protein
MPIFDQHETIQERKSAALEFLSDFDWPGRMCLDTMDNVVVTEMGAWPLRFYVVQGGKLVHKAAPTKDYTYSIDELRAHLTACLQG